MSSQYTFGTAFAHAHHTIKHGGRDNGKIEFVSYKCPISNCIANSSPNARVCQSVTLPRLCQGLNHYFFAFRVLSTSSAYGKVFLRRNFGYEWAELTCLTSYDRIHDLRKSALRSRVDTWSGSSQWVTPTQRRFLPF